MITAEKAITTTTMISFELPRQVTVGDHNQSVLVSFFFLFFLFRVRFLFCVLLFRGTVVLRGRGGTGCIAFGIAICSSILLVCHNTIYRVKASFIKYRQVPVDSHVPSISINVVTNPDPNPNANPNPHLILTLVLPTIYPQQHHHVSFFGKGFLAL